MSFDEFLEQDLNWERTYPSNEDGLVLNMEPIPTGAHFINLRSKLSRKDWNLIRRHTYEQAGYRCEICGEKGEDHPVECHEIWDWDLDRITQTLVRCSALCPMCHLVKHPGSANRRGMYPQALVHFKEVNGFEPLDKRMFDYFITLADRYNLLNEVENWKLNIKWAHDKLKEIKEDGQSRSRT